MNGFLNSSHVGDTTTFLLYISPKIYFIKIKETLVSDYIVVFKNPRDASQIVNLARQVMPGNTKFFVWAYRDATKKPFSYLFLDVTPTRDDRFRVSSNIFPHEHPQIMYTPKGV